MRIKLKSIGLLAGLGALLAMVYLLVPTTPTAAQSCIGSGASCNVSTTVNLTITQWDICIGSKGTFDFGSTTIASSVTTVQGAFTGSDGYFYVDDLRGSNSGYYTTIQMSGNLVGPGGASIPAANVAMKTTAVGSGGVTLLTGTANTRVVIHSGMGSYQALNTPKRLIERNTTPNQGVIGKYGVLPQMQVTIPAYQSVGQYSGTLVFTLYEPYTA